MDPRPVPKGASGAILKKLSIMPVGLRKKLMVAFALMSVLPLLVMAYVVSDYVIPRVDSWTDLSAVIGAALLLSLLGFMVAKKLVFPVIRLAADAQAIAAGEIERHVEVKEGGELGDLGAALNRISEWARESMAQLKVYGEQAKHLNMEINERVLALSCVLQASNLITQSAKLEEVRSFILDKLSQLEWAELNCLLEPLPGHEETFVVQAAAGKDRVRVELLLKQKVVAPWLARSLWERRSLAMDDRVSSTVDREFLENVLGMQNIFCQPLTCMGKPVALLISANRKPNFVFVEESLSLLKVFAKQMAIAIENDFLAKRAAMLEIKDDLTGLYNGAYIRSRLEEEVLRAVRYNRPCSFILLKADEFLHVQEVCGGALAGEKLLRQMAELIASHATEVDRVGRTGQDEFAMILPEQNKREAVELAEEIRAQIAETRFGAAAAQRSNHALTVSVGVSENPIDGATGQELLGKAASALEQAKQGKNRVIAA